MKKQYFSPEFDFMRIEFEDMMANGDPHLVHSDPQDSGSGGGGHGDDDPFVEG